MTVVEQSGLTGKIAALGERAALGTGIEIAEIQVRGAGNARLVRVYIDKPEGVTHGDCELISERLGKLLDEEDVIPDGSYTLEVSSPGVERKLSKPRDFERVVGKKIWLALSASRRIPYQPGRHTRAFREWNVGAGGCIGENRYRSRSNRSKKRN